MENKFDDGIYAFLYNYWKEHSGEYDPKGNVVASNTANHLSLEYKTENELKFAQWAMREYGMTNKERTTHTFKGQMSVLLEVWNVVDMITLPISLVSAGGKFIGKEVAKEVAEELGEKAVKEVAEEAVEKTVKKEIAEEVAENTAKKEMADMAEDLSQKHINKDDALEGSKAIERESSTAELNISSRNTSRGNPNAINHFDVDLNTRQQNLLNHLPDYDSSVIVKKSDVSLSDLAALTAKTGDEFAMFTRGSQRLIIRGNPYSVNINGDLAQQLYNAGYKWSGHTHPGTGFNVKIASEGDRFILEQFNQSRSSIYDSSGQFDIFGGD